MYVQLDAHFDEHPSHAELELEHFGLISCALAYCLRNLTDGHLPLKAVRGFGKSGKGIKVANQLVAFGRWEHDGNGYLILGYLQHNPSRAEVLAKREARAKAGKTGGLRSGESRSKNEASASPVASTMSKQEPKQLASTLLNPSLSLSQSLALTQGERAPVRDAELGFVFAAGCAESGNTVVPSSFAWRDLSDAALAHWPQIDWETRRKLMQSATKRWCETADDYTRKRGYQHTAFVAWLNAGNAKTAANIAEQRGSDGLTAAERKTKQAAKLEAIRQAQEAAE
jgi:hypothetical protein